MAHSVLMVFLILKSQLHDTLILQAIYWCNWCL